MSSDTVPAANTRARGPAPGEGRAMIPLAAAVLVCAIAFGAIGVGKGAGMLIGIGVAGVLLAAVTFRSAAISAFIRIFVAIFAVEYIVFGACVALEALGLWPEGYEDYTLPGSLPATVAVFGILAWGAWHIPVVRTIMGIADLYFRHNEVGTARIWPFGEVRVRESRLAAAAIVTLVLINQAQVAISVRLSFFNRDWFNAIQDKNQPLFWSLLFTVFFFWAIIYIASAVIEYVITSGFTIRWRQFLTDYYVREWQSDGVHYRMALVGGQADNPDQRIADDVRRFIGGSDFGLYDISIRLLATLSSLVSFSIVLWTISSSFPIPGTDIVIPGFLFWTALIYAGIGTAVTHWIGRTLVPLNYDQQRYEADFRFSLARLREYAEQIALLRGEPAERAHAMGRFRRVIANFWAIVGIRKRLMAFTAFYGQISPIIPYIIVAPFYFAGKVQLGTMSQTAGAFSNVEGALTFFINYYTSLAEYRSVVDRLTTFDDNIHAAEALGTVPPRIDVRQRPGGDVDIDGLTLRLPDGRAIVGVEGLALRAGESTLLTGPSGSGKSTLLRALSGIWPYGQGQIGVPAGASVMLLPQRPYIPMGTLRNAVIYPSTGNAYTDGDIVEALKAARLGDLAGRLDEEEAWGARLSGGEQQRLAVARALLARPDWLFLDEATSALDEPLEKALYAMLAERLPDTTVVSIGHRSTLIDMHERRLDMRPSGNGLFSPQEVSEPAAA